jgi:hypothetical protein
VRLLFLQSHRETDRFFTASGVHLAHSTISFFSCQTGGVFLSVVEGLDDLFILSQCNLDINECRCGLCDTHLSPFSLSLSLSLSFSLSVYDIVLLFSLHSFSCDLLNILSLSLSSLCIHSLSLSLSVFLLVRRR